MKKNLPALIPTILAATFLSAQVTITYATHGINVGNTFSYYSADTTGVQAGSTGTGQTWNFGSLVIGSTLGSVNYVSPGSTPYGSSFSTSNLAASDGSGQYEYYNGTSSVLNLTGAANSQTTIPYSNSELVMNYPFAYSNTATDNLYSTYTSNSINVIRSGTVSVTADGSGTLILPSGSYNVLRVKTVQTMTDSFVGFYSAQYYFVTYTWYSAAQKFPLMTFNQLSTTLFSSTNYSENVLINSQVVGIAESPSLITGINLFPNPASDNANLNFTLAENQPITISISDPEGKKILEINRGELSAGEYFQNIDVTSLSKGIYFVKIQGEKNSTCSKLIVQ